MAGISIPFVADVRSFLKGTSDVEGALDDVIDSLDDVAQAGKDVERVIGDSMEDVERSTDDASDNLEKSFRDAFDKVERDARTSGEKAGRNFAKEMDQEVDKGTRQIKEAGTEAGDEFSQNLGGAIASGDFSTIAQETAGGLAGTFGKAGPIGLALTALLGVGIAVFSAMQARAEQLSADTQTLYDNITQGADETALRAAALESAFMRGNYVDNMSAMQQVADALGISLEDAVDTLMRADQTSDAYLDAQREIDRLQRKQGADPYGITKQELDRLLAAKDYVDAVNRQADAKRAVAKTIDREARLENDLADDGERHARAAKDRAEYQRESLRLTDKQIAKAKTLQRIEARTRDVLQQQNDAKRRDPRYVN
jgi:DNA-binding ferritin-like protein (Dps family)